MQSERVSMVALIANPDRFDKQEVSVSGYFHFQMEDCCLFLSKQDGDHFIYDNGVWIDLDPKVQMRTDPKRKFSGIDYFDRKYVVVTGTFHKANTGHLGICPAGGIVVKEIEDLWYHEESVKKEPPDTPRKE